MPDVAPTIACPPEKPREFCARPVPELASFDPAETARLHRMGCSVLDGAKALLDFVDADRAAARSARIDTVAAEISGIIEGERLLRVVDALEHAASRGRPVQLTREGLAVLRRAEALIAEANASITSHLGAAPTPAPSKEGAKLEGQAKTGAAAKADDGVGGMIWIPVVGIGAALVVAVLVSQSRK